VQVAARGHQERLDVPDHDLSSHIHIKTLSDLLQLKQHDIGLSCPDFRPLALVTIDPQVAGDQTLWTTTPFDKPIKVLQAGYLAED